MKRVVLAGLVFISGCAAGEDITCSFTYNVPDAELQQPASEAMARWSTATGCSLTISPAGVRLIEVVPFLSDGGDGQATAATFNGGKLIQVHQLNPNKPRSLLHEIGHSLGMTGHNAGHGVLSNDKDYVPIIDGLSLSDVCSNIPCLDFIPEGDP
jgi:hypothetical protein